MLRILPVLKRAVIEFQEDNLTDWAAALTYYGLLALFPALIAAVSLLGLFGDPKTTTSSLTDIITSIGPQSAAQTFSGPINSIVSNQSAAGFAFVLGLVVALWSVSSYIGAFMRASNIIYETPEGRPFWKLRPLQLAVTLAMIVLLGVASRFRRECEFRSAAQAEPSSGNQAARSAGATSGAIGPGSAAALALNEIKSVAPSTRKAGSDEHVGEGPVIDDHGAERLASPRFDPHRYILGRPLH